MNTRLNTWFVLLTLFLCAGFVVAQDSSPRKVVVTCYCTSGMPSPVMTLEQWEMQEYSRLLAQFRARREDEQDTFWMPPFYSGLGIQELGPGDTPISDFRIYGRRITVDAQEDERTAGRWRSPKLAPDNALERYLLGLARDKGVLPEKLYEWIIGDIEKKGEDWFKKTPEGRIE